MRTCPSCGRAYAEVRGAPEQACPHCGFVTPTPTGAPAASATPAGHADAWGAASFAFRFWLRNALPLLLVWLPVVVANGVAAILLVMYAESTGIPADPFDMNDAQRLRYLGVALPLASASLVVELAAWGSVAAFLARREGTSAPAPPRAATLLALGALLTVAYIAGAALLLVPFFIFFHWFLHAPAVAGTEGVPVGKAMERSRAFARERRTAGFTALVVLVWAALFLVELVLAPGFAAFFALFGLPAPYAQALGPVLASWPLAPLLPLMPAAFWSLVKRAGDASPLASVAADAPASERFRTTKCPKCATLVPFTATGQPVDITCPVCGTKGRVL